MHAIYYLDSQTGYFQKTQHAFGALPRVKSKKEEVALMMDVLG